MQTVMALLADERLDGLVGETSPFDELPRTMARLAGQPDGVLCHRVLYNH
jgi:hypothetical protein